MQSPSTSTAPTQTTAPVSLLRLIAEDETFRAKLESDPVAAFAEHGVNVEFDGQPTIQASVWDDIREWIDSVSGEGDDTIDPNRQESPWMGLV